MHMLTVLCMGQMFSPAFFKESLGHFRTWVDERERRVSLPLLHALTFCVLVLRDSFIQVRDSGATVLVESPSAMAGLHIAEALGMS